VVHLTEKRQLADVMTPAKGRDFCFNRRTHLHASTGANIRALKIGFSTRAPGMNESPLTLKAESSAGLQIWGCPRS
jgi:hypothetical protein